MKEFVYEDARAGKAVMCRASWRPVRILAWDFNGDNILAAYTKDTHEYTAFYSKDGKCSYVSEPNVAAADLSGYDLVMCAVTHTGYTFVSLYGGIAHMSDIFDTADNAQRQYAPTSGVGEIITVTWSAYE